MKTFTYNQYIKCIHTFRLNAVMQLAEESAQYNLEYTKKKYSHDKLIKNVLQDKKEVAQFINQFLEPREKVKEDELVRFNNSYITKKYKSKEADLVYKIKSKELFFLIEHQSTIDNNMPYRMLNYCLDIMREWGRNKKQGRITSYPIIVPIIVYTGNQKWRLPKNFREVQFNDYIFEKYKIELEYNFIDVNRISKQVLLEKDTMFGYAMFLEKAIKYEELIENLETIVNSTTNKEHLEELANIISYLLSDILDEKIHQRLLEKIERKSGEGGMSILIDRLKKDAEEQYKKQIKEEIVKNMLNKKIDEKLILEITKIKKVDLEVLKKELSTVG